MEEFEKVQQILGKRYTPRPQKYESLTSGLLRCSCGGSVVIERIRKLIKAKNIYQDYAYARCNRQKKGKECIEPSITLGELEDQAREYLASIRISDAFHKWAIKNIQQAQQNEQASRIEEVNSLRKAHDDCQKKLDNLLELKISPANSDGSLLNDEEFKRRKTELTLERDKLSESIKQIDYRADKWADLVQDAFDTAYNAQREFEACKDVQRKKVLLAKVGANFILKQGKLHVEGKQEYIVFEKNLPQIRIVEERGKLEESILGKPKKATLNELVNLWRDRPKMGG